MSDYNQIKKPISNEIEMFEKHFRSALKTPVPLLDIIFNYIIRRKGKQIRPMFVFLSAQAAGGINDTTYTAATMIELLHTATLIHDDVVDESYERRGYFSINALWKSKIAVLVGDYLLSKGLLIALENKNYDLLHTVSDAVKKLSEGELQQLKSARKNIIDQDNYFEIINKKTASLIKSCTTAGAQSATKDQTIIESLAIYGELTGIAFQIKDDLFDYQEKGLIGKPVGNDIKDKKFTLPLILALKNSNEQEAKKIIKLVNNNHKNRETLKYIIDFVERNNGISMATSMMYTYRDNAIKALDSIIQSNAKQSLIELVNFTVEREK